MVVETQTDSKSDLLEVEELLTVVEDGQEENDIEQGQEQGQEAQEQEQVQVQRHGQAQPLGAIHRLFVLFVSLCCDSRGVFGGVSLSLQKLISSI